MDTHLNSQQLEAIQHKSGPLLIIAGAGTGKTTVIVERIKWLISKGHASPQEILGLTFTEKASLEMQTRLDEVMPLGYTRMWIMTFHGFCESLLRENALDIGLDPQFKVLTQIDSVALLKKHFFEFDLDYYRPLGNPHKFLNAITTFFSRLCDEDVSPLEFTKWAANQEDQKYQELAKLRLQFQKIKEEKGVLDFGDLISYTLHLLEKRPKILETYRQKFKYILVDEFQDTNFAQIKLIKLLLDAGQNITVVADDDQAIYQWRGAATGNVVAFQKSFPKIKLVTLNQNYRSTQTILDNAHQLISFNNPDRLEIAAGIDKKLISQDKKAGPAIEVLSAQTASAEAEIVAAKIIDLNISFKDIAILVRANNHAELFIKSLENLGVPAQFLGPGKLFLQPEIKDLLALLRLINDPNDNTACYRVLKMSYWQIPGTELTQILAGSPASTVLKSAQDSHDKTVVRFVNLYQHALENIHVKSPGETLYVFLEESGMLKDMLDYKLPISETQAKNISKFFNKIKQFETENPDTSLSGLLEWIDLSLELGESPAAVLDSDWSLNDAVNILTYHSAKGLEFPVVFMVNLVTGRFPSLNRKDPIEVPVELIKEISPAGDPHIQEERRLFYVGMTRAKNQLFFSLAQSYGEGIREKKPSPFIAEALGVHSSEFMVHGETQKIIPSPKKLSMNHEPTNQLTINYITYSQIQTFLDCPLHYKAKYVLHLPTPPSAASSFGNTIHATLNTFFKDPKKDILQTFKSLWKNEGFENKKHEELYFQKGEQYLTKFIFQNPSPYPNTIKLEESFKFFLGDLTVSGKIDRVDILPDGKIEIIDYKTSPKMLTPKEAATDLQLSIYALAATKLQEKPFAKKPEDIILSLYYLDTQTKVTTTRTQEQLDDAEKQILEYVSQIESSDFKCSGSFICQKCDFASLCDTTV